MSAHHSPQGAPLLGAQSLAFVFPDGHTLFQNIDLAVGSERVGLVGANGSGKTVLLELLAGVRPPTSGRVERRGRLAYLPQRRSTATGLTGSVADRLGISERLEALGRIERGSTDPADFELVGADGWDLTGRAARSLTRVGLEGVELDRSTAELSGGQITRLETARALIEEPDVLILDEPTNDLDRAGRDTLLEMVESWSGGLLVVSHDRELLRQVDRIMELSPSGLREYGGGWELYEEQKRTERAAALDELASAEAAKKKAMRVQQAARERQDRRAARGRRDRKDSGIPKILLNGRRAQAERTAARGRRVMEKVHERADDRVSEARGRIDDLDRMRIDLRGKAPAASKELLAFADVSYRYPGARQNACTGVSFRVCGSERVALTGPNGSGKSTVLRLALGGLDPSDGILRRGLDPRAVGFLDQEQALLGKGRSVLGGFRSRHPGWTEPEARHVLARYLFPGERALVPVETLSGGERMRAALAYLLGGSEQPRLLVLDEPTNHLDLESIEVLEAALKAYRGAVLVASHDPDFLRALAVDRVVELVRPEPFGSRTPPP